MGITLKSNYGFSNGTTEVTLAGPPSSGVTQIVRTITATNLGATPRTVTIRINDDSDTYALAVRTLAENQTLAWTAMLVLESPDDTLELVLDGGADEVEWTVHYAEST